MHPPVVDVGGVSVPTPGRRPVLPTTATVTYTTTTTTTIRRTGTGITTAATAAGSGGQATSGWQMTGAIFVKIAVFRIMLIAAVWAAVDDCPTIAPYDVITTASSTVARADVVVVVQRIFHKGVFFRGTRRG